MKEKSKLIQTQNVESELFSFELPVDWQREPKEGYISYLNGTQDKGLYVIVASLEANIEADNLVAQRFSKFEQTYQGGVSCQKMFERVSNKERFCSYILDGKGNKNTKYAGTRYLEFGIKVAEHFVLISYGDYNTRSEESTDTIVAIIKETLCLLYRGKPYYLDGRHCEVEKPLVSKI